MLIEIDIHNHILMEVMLHKGEMSLIFDEVGENPKLLFNKIYNKYFKKEYKNLNLIFLKDQNIHILHLEEGLGK